MNVADVLDEVAAALGTIDGLRAFAYLPDRVVPPAAIVDLPTIEYDATFRRGGDRLTLPVTVLVSRADTRTARDSLLALAGQVKAAVESHTPVAYHSARVQSVEFNHSLTVAGVDYAAASFTVDIIGSGS